MNNAKPFTDKTLHSLLTGLAGNESFVFLESTRITSENHLSYLFLEPVARLVCNKGNDPADFFRLAQEKLEQGFFLAGYFGYEFGYMLEPSLQSLLDRDHFRVILEGLCLLPTWVFSTNLISTII